MLTRLPKRILGLVLCLVWASGCVATTAAGIGAAAGVGGYKWLEGSMEKEYPYPFAQTWEATLAAVEHFRMKTVERKVSPLSGRIEASQPDGTLVRIEVQAKPNQITAVAVRFGYLGNKDASLMFHNQVAQELRM
ncbi:MAG: DUF3568 family protein [Desulfobacca sp.]|nr:DUF3568 family protein [Desulfobacca sp.]